MNMSFLTSFISRASLKDTRRRLERLFRDAASTDEYSLADLLSRLEQSRPDEVLPVLAELIGTGSIDQLYRVNSPSRGGIHDFASLAEVPDRIYDWRQDREIDVEPRMIRVLFRKHEGAR